MNNLQIIETLCEMVRTLLDIVQKLEDQLEQVSAVSDEDRRAIEQIKNKSKNFIE